VECAIPWWLIPVGEQRISSSLAAILIASLPLVTALLAFRVDHTERVRGLRLVGLFIGLGGVVLLLGIDVGGSGGEILGALAILGATLCYATGLFIVKRHFSDVNPIGAVAVALAISTVMLAPAGIASIPGSELGPGSIWSIVILGAVCSALALILFFSLIADVGATRASVITYVNPAVAVLLGVAILGESLGPAAVAGMLLILAGSWLSTGGRLPPGLAAVATAIPARRRREAPARLAVGESPVA
jgi:drug/metabolite transporter (DMT)-like permease